MEMLILVDANVHLVPLDTDAAIEGPSSSLLLLEVRISNLPVHSSPEVQKG